MHTLRDTHHTQSLWAIMKKVYPYLLTVTLFCVLFILTQKVETGILYLGFSPDSGSVVNNHKTSIQIKIFVYGLALWLAFLNLLPTVRSSHLRLRSKISLSALSIVLIYTINYYLSKAIDSGGFNIYYDWRKNMGLPLAVITIVLSIALIWIVHYLKINRTTNSITK